MKKLIFTLQLTVMSLVSLGQVVSSYTCDSAMVLSWEMVREVQICKFGPNCWTERQLIIRPAWCFTGVRKNCRYGFTVLDSLSSTPHNVPQPTTGGNLMVQTFGRQYWLMTNSVQTAQVGYEGCDSLTCNNMIINLGYWDLSNTTYQGKLYIQWFVEFWDHPAYNWPSDTVFCTGFVEIPYCTPLPNEGVAPLADSNSVPFSKNYDLIRMPVDLGGRTAPCNSAWRIRRHPNGKRTKVYLIR